MQPNNSADNPAALIPAAHLPQAAAVAAQSAKDNPNMLVMLQQMQKQINDLMGVATLQQDLPDVVIVNPSGRIVAISGRNATEYLSKPGFRKATEQEESRYNQAILRQTKEYLKRLEAKRIRDEQSYLDNLEKEGELDEADLSSLLTAPVTDAQKTGALEPDQVAKLNGQIVPSTPPANAPANTNVDTGSDNQEQKPPSRRAKATNASKEATSQTEGNK